MKDSNKSKMVSIPPNSCNANDSVDRGHRAAAEHYYGHHDHYEHNNLMEYGAPVLGSIMRRDRREQLGYEKPGWAPFYHDLNHRENVGKELKHGMEQRSRPRRKEGMWT